MAAELVLFVLTRDYASDHKKLELFIYFRFHLNLKDMNDEKHPLKVNKFWTNPDYLGKLHTYCLPTIKPNSREYSTGINNCEVSLDISIKLHTKKDNVLVLDSDFTQFYEVVLSNTENKEVTAMDKTLFSYRINETFKEVITYLESNIPLNTFAMPRPLIDGPEKIDLANDIFEKLIKHPS